MSKKEIKKQIEELSKQTDDWDNNQLYLQLKQLPLESLIEFVTEQLGDKHKSKSGGNPQKEAKEYSKHKDSSLDAGKIFIGQNRRHRKRDARLGNVPQKR
jgi:hypothetical protein